MVIFCIKVRISYRDLRPWDKIELEVIHISLKTDVSGWLKTQAYKAFLRGLTLNFSRMLGNFITGSPGEMNYSERFQIVFKKLMCCEQIFS